MNSQNLQSFAGSQANNEVLVTEPLIFEQNQNPKSTNQAEGKEDESEVLLSDNDGKKKENRKKKEKSQEKHDVEKQMKQAAQDKDIAGITVLMTELQTMDKKKQDGKGRKGRKDTINRQTTLRKNEKKPTIKQRFIKKWDELKELFRKKEPTDQTTKGEIDLQALTTNQPSTDSQQAPLRKNERKAKIKQDYTKRLRELKKWFKKKLLNNPTDDSIKNILKDNLFRRKAWRIFILVLIVAAILAVILLFYYKFGFVRGSTTLGNNESIVMNIDSCSLMIYDIQNRISQTVDVNFLSGHLFIPSVLGTNENVYMQYIYPNTALSAQHSTYSFSEDNGVKTYTFNNRLKSYECEIVMFLYDMTSFQQFDINCGDYNQCNIIINSEQFSASEMTITGVNVQMNAPLLMANTFTYSSMKGWIEIPFFMFNTASIITREGDVSIQSSNDISLSFYQKDPYNCITATTIQNPATGTPFASVTDYQTSITLETAPTGCKAVYPWGIKVEDQNSDNIIEYRCYKGAAQLINQNQGFSQLYVENSFGNINVNVIQSYGEFVQVSNPNIKVYFNKASQDDDPKNNVIDYINFSTQSHMNLVNSTKSAANPKVFDPLFVFDMGPKFTRSATFQQVQFSYNPAYSYIKPYWLGELTLTLMTTKKYSGQYTMSPGFCPYVPALSLERIQKTQQMISDFMIGNNAPRFGVISNTWQPYIDYPPQKFDPTESYFGYSSQSLKRHSDEVWIGVDVDEAKNYNVVNYDISFSGSLYAAIIVSCILSGIFGIIFLVIIVFAVNQNYIWVLNHIQSVRKYAVLEKGGIGEIDESTLDVQKRRYYLHYLEKHQSIEDQRSKQLEEVGENPENEDSGFIPKYTISTIFVLFYQLIYLSPPLSAFIDYVVLLLHKAKQNSISEFYKLLFRSKKLKELTENEYEDIHSLDKDSIQGNEMKQLYEKFCYLNQYLERKFDDQENMKFLTKNGFKIISRHDAQTQYFTYIKYQGNIPSVMEEGNKSSLDLFIKHCCSLTKFETDCIESSELDSLYQEFCTMNHMTKVQLNEGSLKRGFGISTIYLPQQWVERDEYYDVTKEKIKYFIDKRRVENNFKILLAKDSFLFSMLYDTEDMKQAQRDIQVPTGWQFFDLITVIAHIVTMTLLGSPLLLLAIFIRTQQSSYSLLSPLRLIYYETILYYPTSIPAKLIDDNWIVMAITIVTIIFWGLSFFDLIFYYASMDFPQEKYFNEYNLVSKKRKVLSGLMWIIVLISCFTFAVYFSLVAIWLMLSAIINPTAFLPYATTAATFVTLVAKKYKEFQGIWQNGFKILSDYLSTLATGQFQDLLKKMNIQDQVADLVPTETLKDITAEASKFGIIDPQTSEEIQNNLEIMIRDPTSVSKLGAELVKISEDPQAFANQMSLKLEEKAKAIILQQVGTIDKDLRDELVNLIWCLLMNQKSELKNTISSFVNVTINSFQRKQGKQILKNLSFLNLKGPVFDFIWELAFPQENFKGNYHDHLTDVFCVALSSIIGVWNKQLKPVISAGDQDGKKQLEENAGNKKNKKQAAGKSEQELLKDRLIIEIEKAETVNLQENLQEAGEDEQQLEIDFNSEEAIQFAYKNIIFSMIQICRAISSDNSEIILNEVLALVKNTNKLRGFQGLNQLQKYQDIFKLGYAVFKNDGKVNYEVLSSAFKSFFKNSGLEKEVKSIAGVSMLDVLKVIEVIISSFKSQGKQSNNSVIKQTITNLLGSLDFVNYRQQIQSKDYNQDVKSLDQCHKVKESVIAYNNQLTETIKNYETVIQNAKSNEEPFKVKVEKSLQSLREYSKNLLFPQSEQNNNADKNNNQQNNNGENKEDNKEECKEDMKDQNIENNNDNNKEKPKENKNGKQKENNKEENKEKNKENKKEKNKENNNKNTTKILKIEDIDNLSAEKLNQELSQFQQKTKDTWTEENKKNKNQIENIEKEIKELNKELQKSSDKYYELYDKIANIKVDIQQNKKKDGYQTEKKKLKDEREKEIAAFNKEMKSLQQSKLKNDKKLAQIKESDLNGEAYVPSEGDIQEPQSARSINLFCDLNDINDLSNLNDQQEDELIDKNKDQNKGKKNNKDNDDSIRSSFKIEDMTKLNEAVRKLEQKNLELEDKIKIANEKKEQLQAKYEKEVDDLNKKNGVLDNETLLQDAEKEKAKELTNYREIESKIALKETEIEKIQDLDKKSKSIYELFENTMKKYQDAYKTSNEEYKQAKSDQKEYQKRIDSIKDEKKKLDDYNTKLAKKEKEFKLLAEKEQKSKHEEIQLKAIRETEESHNIISSGITIMLNFFSGSISNLPSNLITDFGNFFKNIKSSQKENAGFFDFLSSYIVEPANEQQKEKSNPKIKQKLSNFQSLLNLMDIFLNDCTTQANKITKNGIQNKLDNQVASSLQTLFTCRFEGFSKIESINKNLMGSDLLELISVVMKMKEDTILGFLKILLGFKDSSDFQTFFNYAASLNKIKQNKVPILLQLYTLYQSKNPSELFHALNFFKVATNVDKSQSANVDKEQPILTTKELVLVMVFLRGSLEYRYVQSIIEEKLKIPAPKMDEEQIQLIKSFIKSSTLPSQYKKLFEIETRGQLQVANLSIDFKDINRNLSIMLDQADFNFFKKFASIRNIPRFEDPNDYTLVKSSISDISDMLNIDYHVVELFVNILISSKPAKIQQALNTINIKKINPMCDNSDIEEFVNLTSSVLEKIEQRTASITNVSKNIFSDKLNSCLLRKILYHEDIILQYNDYLQIFNIYCNNEIPDSIRNLIDFRFGLTGSRKRDIFNFLNPLKINSEKEYKKFKEKSRNGSGGLVKAIQIISINEQTLRIQVFLQYLIKTKQDALLMTSCLLVYFSGRSSNITLYTDPLNKEKTVNVEQLICQLLQVKQEFFEALHTYFQEDTNQCTQTMIKFYRQLDYLEQQDQSEGNMVLKNNVTISDKNVEQYVRLVNHMQFNTSFISKDCNIPIEAVELIANLMYIRNAKNETERNAVFEQMRSNTYISKIYSQLGVNHQELVSLIKIMYGDNESTNIKWISRSLKLPPHFNIDGLQQLIMLDSTLPVYGESSQNKKHLVNLIKTNKLIKSLKINTTWAEIAYILVKGEFRLLSLYQDKLLPLKYPTDVNFERILDYDVTDSPHKLTKVVHANEKKYGQFIQGIIGASSFSTTEFLYQLYTIITQKEYKSEHIIIEDGLKKGNTLQYAIYKFTRATLICPMWTLLMMGDFNTWEYLAQSHYLVNSSKKSDLNPIMTLVYVLNFRACPLIIKQLLVDLEFVQRSYQIYKAKRQSEIDTRKKNQIIIPPPSNDESLEKDQKLNKDQKLDQDQELNKDKNLDQDKLLVNEKEEEERKQKEEEEKKQKEEHERKQKEEQERIQKEEQERNKQEEEKKDKLDKWTLLFYEEKIKTLKNQINDLLLKSVEKDGDRLIRMAADCNFPKKVIDMLLLYEHDYIMKKRREEEENGDNDDDDFDDDEEKKKKVEDKEIRLTSELVQTAISSIKSDLFKQIFNNMVSFNENKIRKKPENKKEYGEINDINELDILCKVFENVSNVFYTDPRRDSKRTDVSDDQKIFSKNYCMYTLTSSPLMQMVVLSTISQLKHSYNGFYGLTDLEEDQYRQVTFAINLLLGTFEKYFYFDDMMDFFPHHRLIPLIGLSIGFIIESDDIINSYISNTIFDKKYFDDVLRPICVKAYGEQNKYLQDKNKQNLLELKFDLKYKYFKNEILGFSVPELVEDAPDQEDKVSNQEDKVSDSKEKASDQEDKASYQEEKELDSVENKQNQGDKVQDQAEKVKDEEKKVKEQEDKVPYEVKKIREYLKGRENEYCKSQYFKKIDIPEIITCLNDKNFDRLIYSYDEFIYRGYFTEELIMNSKMYSHYRYYYNYYSSQSYDHYTGEDKKIVESYLNEFARLGESDNFKLLIDIYKEDYKSLNNNDYFTVSYGQDSNLYFGILFLNGLITQSMEEVKMDEFQAYVNSTTLFMSSNKNALAEILSLLLPSLNTNFTSLKEIVNVSENILANFINLAMAKSINPPLDLQNLIQKANISETNKRTVKLLNIIIFKIYNLTQKRTLLNCVWAYSGEMSEHLKLLHFSPYFSISENQTAFFTKFLWSLEKGSMHKTSNNPYTINYFHQSNLSPKREKALEKAQKYLWKISTLICYKKWKEDNPRYRYYGLDYYKLQHIYKGKYDSINEEKADVKTIDDQMSQLLHKILDNDWSFLIDKKDKKSLQHSFNIIFQVDNNDQCLEKLQILTLLKPQNCKIKINSSKLDIYINKKEMDKMIEVGDDFLQDKTANKKCFQLLLSLSNNSIVHILNCLNPSDAEWKQNIEQKLQEQKTVNENLEESKNLSKAEPQKSEENKKKQDTQKEKEIKPKKEYPKTYPYQFYILQSLFQWKNMSRMQWDNISNYLINSVEKQSEKQKEKQSEKSKKIDFSYSYIQQLSILPAFILDNGQQQKNDRNSKNNNGSKIEVSTHASSDESTTVFKLLNRQSQQINS